MKFYLEKKNIIHNILSRFILTVFVIMYSNANIFCIVTWEWDIIFLALFVFDIEQTSSIRSIACIVIILNLLVISDTFDILIRNCSCHIVGMNNN